MAEIAEIFLIFYIFVENICVNPCYPCSLSNHFCYFCSLTPYSSVTTRHNLCMHSSALAAPSVLRDLNYFFCFLLFFLATEIYR